KGNIYFVNYQSDPEYINIRKVVYHKNMNLVQQFMTAPVIKINNKERTMAVLRGTDNDGNFFISSKASPSEPYLFEKFNSQGDKLGEIHLKWQCFHMVNNPFKVSDKGDLYVLSSDQNGLWIEKYPASL
ncbi:MAG: hypothetical protein GWN62_12780, partial [Aliifodinibius sp.]|nr:hypothetical protein [Fodinibius sp.]